MEQVSSANRRVQDDKFRVGSWSNCRRDIFLFAEAIHGHRFLIKSWIEHLVAGAVCGDVEGRLLLPAMYWTLLDVSCLTTLKHECGSYITFCIQWISLGTVLDVACVMMNVVVTLCSCFCTGNALWYEVILRALYYLAGQTSTEKYFVGRSRTL